MNLEQRYNAAAATSYVGRVRATQAADAGVGKGVDFMDGTPKTAPTAMDAVQTEFTRNAEGDFRYNGGGKTPAATNDKSYPLSRWLAPGVNAVDTYFVNNRFTTIGDTRNAPGTMVHKYSTLNGKRFDESAILSALSKGKISGAPSGPAPV